MSTINYTVGSSANRLNQSLVSIPTKQILNRDQALPEPTSSLTAKPDSLDSQLTSLVNKWLAAKQALETLSNAPLQISQSRKSFAAEMLKRIKEQIRVMTMLTGGDPKARARQIAVLARELAAAAREYAAASGDTSRTDETPAANGAAVQTENNSTIERDRAAANAVGTTASANEVTPQPDRNNGQATTSPAAAMPYQQASTRQVFEQLANRIAEYIQKSSSAQEDREFALEVRKLAAQLKALAKQNEVHAHKGTDQSTERETAATNEALGEVEHSLAIIDSPNASYSPFINIVAD
jgi:hypothetical protein